MSIYKNGKLVAGGRQCMPLLSFMRADYRLNDASWLRADTFSWQRGAVYMAAYGHLSDDLNAAKEIYSWTPKELKTELSNFYGYDVSYGAGKFVTVDFFNGAIATSTDGDTWTVTANVLGSNSWQCLTYGNGLFVAIAQTGGFIGTSADGITWSASYASQIRSRSWYGLAYGDGKFVLISDDGYVSTSTDGTTWATATQNANLGSNHSWASLTYGNGIFVAVGSSGYVSTSTDGTTWTTATQFSDPVYTYWQNVTFGNGQFIALTNTGYMSTSTDGVTWTTPVQYPNLTSGNWQGLTYGADKFLALGAPGYVSTMMPILPTETVAGVTITYYPAPDGHKIVMPDQESNVMAIYAATGDAWYYILDTTNQRFKLPRRRSRKLIRAGTVSGVWYRLYADGWVEQGGVVTNTAETTDIQLPITMSGTSYTALADLNYGNTGWSATVNVAVLTKTTTSITIQNWYNSSYNTGPIGWRVAGFSAIDTSGFQGNEKYAYFYVGNFTQTALQNTAGLNAELFNGKLDQDFSNVTAGAASALNNVGVRTIVETYASGNDWYRKYSDGWVEQGSNAHNRGSSNRWNFLIGMAGTYNAQITARGSQRYAWVTDMGSTYLTFNAADDSSQNNDGLYYIKVCGYAAS